ncbi:GNAT family N-acetyltransferase [bacterium]|nr:GNAT family N-acetyltransferase [bacterium]
MPNKLPAVTIADLTPEQHSLYFCCLEDWSDEMKEGGDHKANWFRQFQTHGLRVKLAVDLSGCVAGMIQYLPIEQSFADGRDLYLVTCIWVHGHKQGRGNFQKRGFGQALLEAAEEDARALGAKGMATWGLWLPFWMKASWFRKQGYKKADRDSIRVLLWKPFTSDAARPRWIREQKRPQPVPGKVIVTAFLNGWCPAQNMTVERARRACESFGDKVDFQVIHTADRAVLQEWGIADGLFIDGRPVRTGPPPSYEKIHKQIEQRVRRLRPAP